MHDPFLQNKSYYKTANELAHKIGCGQLAPRMLEYK